MTNEEMAERFKAWYFSPRLFIKDVWGLETERDNKRFFLGKHVTWQQDDMLIGIEKAVAGEAPTRISARSGHGIGKTTMLAWLVIWFLITRPDAVVPCTAPTREQIHDILWKELNKWISKMPLALRCKLEWTATHIRVSEHPETWFASAKTAVKEKPEALAGVHAPFVLYIVDEASGVPDEIFKPVEGALTAKNSYMILISNPTRLMGYFYDSHHGDKEAWQCFHFSSEDSPIVDRSYVQRIIEKYGQDSDEYRVRVQGDFPKADAVDEKGYVPLLSQNDLRITNDATMRIPRRLGVDPAGKGTDKAAWVERDAFKLHVCGSEATSTGKSIAHKTVTLMTGGEILDENTIVDSFGVGTETVKELALARHDVRSINVGESASEDDRFINKRSEAYWALREWLRSGGEIVANEQLIKELLSIKFTANLKGKIKIMSKEDMRKIGIPSPNFADAAMLTFVDGTKIEDDIVQQDFAAESWL